jgi:hypothetical protein
MRASYSSHLLRAAEHEAGSSDDDGLVSPAPPRCSRSRPFWSCAIRRRSGPSSYEQTRCALGTRIHLIQSLAQLRRRRAQRMFPPLCRLSVIESQRQIRYPIAPRWISRLLLASVTKFMARHGRIHAGFCARERLAGSTRALGDYTVAQQIYDATATAGYERVRTHSREPGKRGYPERGISPTL